jgi:hypothetical protein
MAKTIPVCGRSILGLVRARKRVPETAHFLHCTGGDKPNSLYSSRRGLWARPGIFLEIPSQIQEF